MVDDGGQCWLFVGSLTIRTNGYHLRLITRPSTHPQTEIPLPRRGHRARNPFGRFAAVAGFGTLPGDLDFYEARHQSCVMKRTVLAVLGGRGESNAKWLWDQWGLLMGELLTMLVNRSAGQCFPGLAC